MMRTYSRIILASFVLTSFITVGCKNEDVSTEVVPFVDINGWLEIMKRESVCKGDDINGYSLRFFGRYHDQMASITTSYWNDVKERYNCIANSVDCNEALRCQGIDPTQPCDPNTFTEQCLSENEFVGCSAVQENSYEQTESCSIMGDVSGNACMLDTTGSPTCGIGSCTTAQEGTTWCDGSSLRSCFAGVEFKSDCEQLDLPACQELVSGGITFADCGPIESCTEDRCEGNRLFSCRHDVMMGSVDCQAYGDQFSCIEEKTEGTCGVPTTDSECNDGQLECQGDVARICYGGKYFAMDCSTFMNATCVTTTVGPTIESVSCVAPKDRTPSK